MSLGRRTNRLLTAILADVVKKSKTTVIKEHVAGLDKSFLQLAKIIRAKPSDLLQPKPFSVLR
jgi:hypothetical protein